MGLSHVWQRVAIWNVALIVAAGGGALANNIAVSNVTLSGGKVRFDLSWDHAWRQSWTNLDSTVYTNWDAAWVFVKYRTTGDWTHASLATNATDHTAPAGAALDVGLTGATGMGVFIYRASTGDGPVSYPNVQLAWQASADGVPVGSTVDLRVHAIEMVYVPEGPFKLGDGGISANDFFEYGSDPDPYAVDADTAITVGPSAGNLWADGAVAAQTLGLDFPRGYRAFYCMKYDLSQGQYAAFLNTLTTAQAANRDDALSVSSYSTRGGTIGGSHPSFSATVPDRACIGPGWTDLKAYADWAGLRPMTELEFEKACRGPLEPAGGEYAWGGATVHGSAYTFNNEAQPNETAANASSDPTGNAAYTTSSGDKIMRCGLFAASFGNPTRAESGASVWGIMELSGNAPTFCVCLDDNVSDYAGSHGDGVLDSDGKATNADWPADNEAGFRGGGYAYVASWMRVSDRTNAGYNSGNPHQNFGGGRAVRTAP